uniref:Uncharacterized protein n=1 Tax=Labrus bergylta TaxID=56723 RepID=A0A3Q3G248_9LABR
MASSHVQNNKSTGQNKIEGVKISKECHKLALYADDVALYITNLGISLPALRQIINNYSSASGYKLNMQKCEAMVIIITDFIWHGHHRYIGRTRCIV